MTFGFIGGYYQLHMIVNTLSELVYELVNNPYLNMVFTDGERIYKQRNLTFETHLIVEEATFWVSSLLLKVEFVSS
jgi:hypothetical protein